MARCGKTLCCVFAMACCNIVWCNAVAHARRPADAPLLPPPDPAVYSVIEVDTAQELADACWNLASFQAIVIQPGVYDLASVTFPNGVDGRLAVGRFGATPIHHVQIRGATGNPADVVLHGAGMLDPTVPFGFQVATATDVLIADLSVSDVYYHAISIQGEQDAARIHLYNLRLFDAGQQIVKGTSGGGNGVEDVLIEYTELFYSSGAVVHPEGSPPNSCYTNAIDALEAERWVIRDNLIHDIRCQNLALAGPSILLWRNTEDSLVERNTILRSSRGVSLGLVEQDHVGGIVRNNFVRWDPAANYVVDVAIYTTSTDARILHNTIVTNGTYPSAIEVRYATSTGVEVTNNLMDAGVNPRNGATPTLSGNRSDALAMWFVDEAAGDLHLTADASSVVDQVDRRPDAFRSFDGCPRPVQPGLVDIGAAELSRCISHDGFDHGATSAWSQVFE